MTSEGGKHTIVRCTVDRTKFHSRVGLLFDDVRQHKDTEAVFANTPAVHRETMMRTKMVYSHRVCSCVVASVTNGHPDMGVVMAVHAADVPGIPSTPYSHAAAVR